MKFDWKRLLQAVAVAALTTTFAPSAWAQTAYLYYAGGAVNPITSIDPADVHTAPTGDQGVFSVWVADINLADGSVSNWRRAGALLPEVGADPADDLYSWLFVENTVHIANGYLYVGAGDWNGDGTRDTADVLAYARIKSDGTLDPFQLSAVFPGTPDDQSIGAGALVNAGGGNVYYYILGGLSSGSDRVLFTKLNPTNGVPGPWSITTSLAGGDWFNRAAVVGTTIIEANGNIRATRDARYATVTPATGALSAWSAPTTYEAGAAHWDYAMTNARSGGNDFVYILGGAPSPITTVLKTQVTAGVPGAWTPTTALPVDLRRVTAASVDNYVYVCGGTTGSSAITAAVSTVQIGTVAANGDITWSASPANMPQARGFGGAAIVKAADIAASVDGWEMY